MPYLLESTLIFSSLFIAYWLLLKNQTQQGMKRGALLSFAVLSLVVPLMTFTFDREAIPVLTETTQLIQMEIPSEVALVQTDHQSEVIANATTQESQSSFWSLFTLLNGYFFGLAVSSALLLWKLFQIAIVWRNKESQLAESSSFSFFNWVFINESLISSELEREMLMSHEKAHVRLGHSYDLLFAEIFKVVFWFNPLVYIFKNELKLIHELQADQVAAKNKRAYIDLLMKEVMGAPLLAHGFYERPIKLRIKALLNTSRKFNIHRWWPLVPMVLVLVGVVACEPSELIQVDEVFQSDEVESIEIIEETPFETSSICKSDISSHEIMATMEAFSKINRAFEDKIIRYASVFGEKPIRITFDISKNAIDIMHIESHLLDHEALFLEKVLEDCENTFDAKHGIYGTTSLSLPVALEIRNRTRAEALNSAQNQIDKQDQISFLEELLTGTWIGEVNQTPYSKGITDKEINHLVNDVTNFNEQIAHLKANDPESPFVQPILDKREYRKFQINDRARQLIVEMSRKETFQLLKN